MLALALLALAQPPAKSFPPDEATAAKIAGLRSDLDAALAKLPGDTKPDLRADVAIYAKAAEWVVRHKEWHSKDTAAQTVRVLDTGINRAKELAAGRSPWREVTGRPVVRGFVSAVDGSVQPAAVTTPAGDWQQLDWQCDVVLHGRDNMLTEVKFIDAKERAKPSASKRVVIEPFGRGNTAYRWAGETDVFEAMALVNPDPKRTVLRGFSMGGAGTWHLGLHHPLKFAAIQPGAGFTTTHGYAKLPDTVPDYVEKCLGIYDAQRYAENVFNLPTVAYSGELDKQKAAADGIERALKGFPEPLRFTHLVAPGLEHNQPPEWVARCDAELVKHLPRKDGERVRFVTHTPRYGDAGRVKVEALEKQYEPAVVEVITEGFRTSLTTVNVRRLRFSRTIPGQLDGQGMPAVIATLVDGVLEKRDGRWGVPGPGLSKTAGRQGPIDDAFLDPFFVTRPTAAGWHPATDRLARETLTRFADEWERYLRGWLPLDGKGHRVLFGDPASNPAIAEVLPVLPIRWTRDELVVNGVRYDATTHLPVLIYPLPLHGYVVLNSGHTFGETEFQGSNALLYPRLGDWAVRKVTGEVVAAGLFDENWQFAAPKR